MAHVACGVTPLSGLGFQVAATAGYTLRAPPAVIDITPLSGRLDAGVARNLLGFPDTGTQLDTVCTMMGLSTRVVLKGQNVYNPQRQPEERHTSNE